MKKFSLIICLLISGVLQSKALIINEIMSNPVGDDGGREWVELYNNSSSTIDISQLTISIKGGTAIPVTNLSGGSIIQSKGYAIIGSTVSGATKFLQDYPTYSGPLFKSSISLVNTGVTSLEIKLNGISVDQLTSYTAAKEGYTLSLINGSFVVSTPTPGMDNQDVINDSNTSQATSTTSATTTANQVTVAQMTPPLADIILYMPFEKVAVAGAETDFSAFAMTRANKPIDNLLYTWAFGDGGQSTGSSTKYRYVYPGRYITQAETGNGYIVGAGRTVVRVVAPDIEIKGISSGKYGTYVDILNPNSYDLDFSQWKLMINNSYFNFPKNTIIAGDSITHITGIAMGFASTTINPGTVVAVVFPNMEEVTRYILPEEKIHDVKNFQATTTVSTSTQILHKSIVRLTSKLVSSVLGVSTSSLHTVSATLKYQDTSKQLASKDTRLISFFKSLFTSK